MTYLNSEVFYHALPAGSYDLVPMPPRAMAAAVECGKLDAGPLPVAEVFRLGDSVQPLADLCVASSDEALSVLLFSDVPVSDLGGRNIGVTDHTATSIQLLRILFRDLWHVVPGCYSALGEDSVARLIIGDDALILKKQARHPYVYDLGREWRQLTGLPCVFATWVIRRDADTANAAQFERALVESTKAGLAHISDIATRRQNDYMTAAEVTHYVSNFTYTLGDAERQGMAEFKNRLGQLSDWHPVKDTTIGPSREPATKA